MKGIFRYALCATAVSFAYAGGAWAGMPVDYSTIAMNGIGRAALSSTVDLSQTVALPELSYGPPAAGSLAITNVEASASLVTGLDLELGYKVDLAGGIAAINSADSSLGSLMLSHPDAGYSAITAGGNFVGVTAAIADDLHFTVGSAELGRGYSSYTPDAYTALARVGGQSAFYNPRSADSLFAGVSWNFASWGDVGLMSTSTSERDGILGFAAQGARADTNALGITARMHLGGGWVTTASYSEGVTQLDIKPSALAFVGTEDSIHTRSYGIAIAKNGVFGNDALGLAISQSPLGSEGNEFITMPSVAGGQQFFGRNHILAGTTPETDIEVGYITTFMDGSLALQTNASFQMNYAGQSGANAVSLLSRARIKF